MSKLFSIPDNVEVEYERLLQENERLRLDNERLRNELGISHMKGGCIETIRAVRESELLFKNRRKPS